MREYRYFKNVYILLHKSVREKRDNVRKSKPVQEYPYFNYDVKEGGNFGPETIKTLLKNSRWLQF